jgi:hypothetical protein
VAMGAWQRLNVPLSVTSRLTSFRSTSAQQGSFDSAHDRRQIPVRGTEIDEARSSVEM